MSYQLTQWCDWLYSSRSNYQFRTSILPYPVDTDSFSRSSSERRSAFRSQHGLLDSDLIIGRVGQDYEAKWSPVLIDVFEDIRHKAINVKLLMVNPPPMIINRAMNSRYSSDIVLSDGHIGDIALSDCYSSIDVFVLIARQGESFGMVLCESLLCETPVVTLSTPWVDNSQGEVVGNRIGGFVAATKYELTSLVENLLFDQKKRAIMGMAGRERTIQLFNYKNVASKSLEIITTAEFGEPAITLRPDEIFDDCIGSVNIASRLILKTGKYFRLLEFTLGYTSIVRFLMIQVPVKIARRIWLFFLMTLDTFRRRH